MHGHRVSSDRRDHRHPAANLDGHAGVVVMDGKKCAKCGEVKPLSEFNLHRKNKDGFDYKCRECAAELQREWRKRNREKTSEYNRKGYLKRTDPQQRKAMLDRRIERNIERLKKDLAELKELEESA